MMKATLRSAVLLGLLAWSVPSFAETQNVKIGGDETIRGVMQKNMDMRATEATDGDDNNVIQATTGINVGADLTENVAAFIRLANERSWGTTGNSNGDFDISQAWVRLKELFYSPITLTIGTQPLFWGRGLVLGSNLYPSLLSTVGAGTDRNSSIDARQFTDFTAFDAVKVDLDLAGVAPASLPVNIQYIYTKLDENTSGEGDDVNLQGVNIGARFDEMNSEVEAYYLNKRDRATRVGALVDTRNNGSVSTWGIRGSTQPVDGAYVFSELALQHGKRGTSLDASPAVAGDNLGSSNQAWMFNLGAEYTLKDVATTPKIGAEWLFYSGHDKDGAVQGWDPIAPGYFTTLIRQYQTRAGITGLYPVDTTGVTSSFTNQSQISIYGGLKPIEDLSVDTRLSWFSLEDGAIQTGVQLGNDNRNSYLGTEWDTWLTYAYTDDVQLGLSYGIFFPGNAFRNAGDAGGPSDDSTAQQLVSTVSVKF